jgi:hypothetical protein
LDFLMYFDIYSTINQHGFCCHMQAQNSWLCDRTKLVVCRLQLAAEENLENAKYVVLLLSARC